MTEGRNVFPCHKVYMENGFFQTAHCRFTESSKKVKLHSKHIFFGECNCGIFFALNLFVSRRHNDLEILTLYALAGQILAKQLHFSYLKNLLI